VHFISEEQFIFKTNTSTEWKAWTLAINEYNECILHYFIIALLNDMKLAISQKCTKKYA